MQTVSIRYLPESEVVFPKSIPPSPNFSIPDFPDFPDFPDSLFWRSTVNYSLFFRLTVNCQPFSFAICQLSTINPSLSPTVNCQLSTVNC
ncbi:MULTISPECIES: hypothetical protein [unclassified Microcoleus]|uniref:hypothetical protein n=1 Tax=unclassified Microcoleus TaxID=2642155 RepID=UPI0025DBEB9D|nr:MULTISPECIES: hypothetical protein [unclassified Microcoleus]